ncbi:hypothetical protein JCM8547_009412 [Rhodosporidiobolus lusitaniae]
MASDSARPPPYILSALLQGHANDVRSLAAPTSTPSSSSVQLLSGSRDCTARLWELSDGSWREQAQWQDAERGWVNGVGFLPAREDEEDKSGYLISAGSDSLIHLFPLSSPSSTPSHTLSGHGGNVCAVRASRDGRRIASASWDMTARTWGWREEEGGEGGKGGWECESVLVGHGAAVWDVLFVEREEEQVVTACADGKVRLFDGADVKYVYKGHEGPVRALVNILPEAADCALFASCSNDGSIRLWNYQTGDSITVLAQQESFIYSIVSLPSVAGGGLASSGEDGIITLYNEEDGEEDQQIVVPALSVWSLAALPNGDLACGCSDNLIWIFTRDAARKADEATTADYEGRMAEFRASKALRTSLPAGESKEVLDTPGTKEGEVKLIAEEDKVQAYQWNGSKWEELGEVVGSEAPPTATPPPAARPARMEHEGVLYDYVFSIDVKDDEPPLKLPFNLDDDPTTAAEAFVNEHSLPEFYTEQIVQFLRASSS